MAQRKKGERVLGPYPHAGGWRLIVVGPGSEKSRREYESKAEAEKVKRWVERELRTAEERTIGDAKKEYAMHLRDDKTEQAGLGGRHRVPRWDVVSPWSTTRGP